MAGDWLKMRHDLADDPAVIRVAADRAIEEDAVLGKLFRLWSWADRHTTEGEASGIGLAWVDRLTRCEGFGAALVRAGWLEETDGGLCFPRFHRHCSDTAKARALTKERTKRWRDGASVTEASPEKSKSRERIPPPPRDASLGSQESLWPAFREAWNTGAAAGHRAVWHPPTPPESWHDRLNEAGWLEKAEDAAKRLPACKFFSTPVTLHQFVGPRFVDLCLGGQYDTPKAAKGGSGQPERPTAAEAAERWEKKAADPRVEEYVRAKAEKRKARESQETNQ